MMFLQYAIWGAWLPLFYSFVTEHRGYSAIQTGNLFSIAAIGALIAPFFAGQIADRWLNTERFLGISHLVGAVLMWQLGSVTSYGGLVVFGLLYSLIFAPTLSLTNSLAFHHLPDRDRDFGKVRIWGTIGWIAVGIGVGQYLLYSHTPATGTAAEIRAAQVAGMADAFKLSAILGAALGVYSFFLPATPPQRGAAKFAAGEAFAEIRAQRSLLVLFLVTFPISCIHQFYFVQTEGFLGRFPGGDVINKIFGVGGGGLMTIGQIAELAVLGFMPLLAKRDSRKTLLLVGVAAYCLRFAVFAYAPNVWAVLPALALHGVCFGCFFFVAFMIVDELTSSDVRATAQSLYNLVAVGLGTIVGTFFSGVVRHLADGTDGVTDFRLLFSVPLWIGIACGIAMILFYPRQATSGTPTH